MTLLFLPADRWTADSIWLVVHGAFQPEHDACTMIPVGFDILLGGGASY